MNQPMQPLTASEMEEISGGIFPAIIAGLSAGMLMSAINHWGDIKLGVMDANRDARNFNP